MIKQMTLSTNPQLELAFQFVQYTNKNIFLTGKAGTGKTTFLHRIKKECIKRAVVVAPTGVAAINAKGMTIHSFFQLPFGPYLPGDKNDPRQQRRFSKDKRDLIKSLDLLIIDEISMVRADLLDGIDDVLRRYKNPTEPFGGVQLLMIGDLHQLPPVVKNEEWHLLKDHYSTAYFFGSQALQKTDPVTVQLQHIYRQSDSIFIDLLNKVRDNQMDQDVLQKLNSRFIDDFKPADDEGYITLTSHNNTANTINKEKLRSLAGKSYQFKAKVDGDFPPHTYPTEDKLEFKIGAQVLFIKNDISHEKLYYNGKIGKITRISKNEIYVKCPTDLDEIKVTSVDWDNVKYTLNDGTKEVDEDVVGTFAQFPLKLAWAITIHKSQGLTFERVIIDAKSAFAHGQVYVALSRCTSFEGIVLRSQIAYSSVKTDSVVKNYSKEADQNAPDETKLLASIKAFQKKMILELFSFKYIQKLASRLERNFLENENSLTVPATEKVQKWIANTQKKVFAIAPTFEKQLEYLIYHAEMPEENEELLERIQKAGTYFSEKIENELESELTKIPVLTDNKVIKKLVTDNLALLTKELFVKKICFAMAKDKFSSQQYLRLKANADLDFEKQKKKTKKTERQSLPSIDTLTTPHPELYNRIKLWRDVTATELEVTPYVIITLRAIIELTNYLPTDSLALLKIKGIGKSKVQKHGAAIIEIIENFCREKKITANLPFPETPKKEESTATTDTKLYSLELFKTGKTIDEIADQRSLTRGTIESHLAHFILNGELDISQIMPSDAVQEIEAYFLETKSESFKESFEHFKGRYSYSQLRMVVNHLQKGK
jgi:hypothetical protein